MKKQKISLHVSSENPSVLKNVDAKDLIFDIPLSDKNKQTLAKLLAKNQAACVTNMAIENSEISISEIPLSKQKKKVLIKELERSNHLKNSLAIYLVVFSLTILALFWFVSSSVLAEVVKPLIALNLLVFAYYFKEKL